eukprot:CAMPEP_0194270768 /NCGR_PEP_ID=MMETSP0169-20130528/4688_1 /TAXON_ID=218684 /ORGANISM="Corethron pennatum, Strain L29A3" /LENGTH=381 /DNA_ID=CAMNT_0039012929 /DNA_START=51 /DNA_END=1193 /DNA_ORIENTATION=+
MATLKMKFRPAPKKNSAPVPLAQNVVVEQNNRLNNEDAKPSESGGGLIILGIPDESQKILGRATDGVGIQIPVRKRSREPWTPHVFNFPAPLPLPKPESIQAEFLKMQGDRQPKINHDECRGTGSTNGRHLSRVNFDHIINPMFETAEISLRKSQGEAQAAVVLEQRERERRLRKISSRIARGRDTRDCEGVDDIDASPVGAAGHIQIARECRGVVRECRNAVVEALAETREKMQQDLEGRRIHHPRNREMWAEVATLREELAGLRREDKEWAKVDIVLDAMEEAVPTATGHIDNEDEDEDEDDDVGDPLTEIPDIRTATKYALQDIALAADRITGVARMASRIVRAAEATRKELYGKYTEHQFTGYGDVSDPKKLMQRGW